jgi:DNA repair photolyase
MLSGNTDCYQPLESNYKITRSLLEVLLKYRHPVGIITKNALVLRDLDLLKKLAEHKLVRVVITITTLDEGLRRNLEPRTSTSSIRLDTINKLSSAGIPTGIMMAPIIPSVNDHEIGDILPKASQAGALSASYTLLRLNGPLPEIFGDWLDKNMPERKTKILNKVKHIHGGSLNDSNFGQRMRGKGNYAEMTHSLFQKIRQKHFSHKAMPELDADQFIRKGQLKLFLI